MNLWKLCILRLGVICYSAILILILTDTFTELFIYLTFFEYLTKETGHLTGHRLGAEGL